MYKRIAAILLVIAITASMLPAAANASTPSANDMHTDAKEPICSDFDLACCYVLLDCDNEVALLFFGYGPHWNHHLGIYGDEPQKINERKSDEKTR